MKRCQNRIYNVYKGRLKQFITGEGYTVEIRYKDVEVCNVDSLTFDQEPITRKMMGDHQLHRSSQVRLMMSLLCMRSIDITHCIIGSIVE